METEFEDGSIEESVSDEDDIQTDASYMDENLSDYERIQEFQNQWIDNDQDGYDDLTGEYYWDDLAEFIETNGLSYN